MKNQDLDTLVDEALTNIRGDRKLAREFLNELANEIASDPSNNRSLSPVAAKHVETMQRSNEQLVKAAQLLYKQQSGNEGLSASDKKDIYDMLGASPETSDSEKD